jgi:hypothetical protein
MCLHGMVLIQLGTGAVFFSEGRNRWDSGLVNNLAEILVPALLSITHSMQPHDNF